MRAPAELFSPQPVAYEWRAPESSSRCGLLEGLLMATSVGLYNVFAANGAWAALSVLIPSFWWVLLGCSLI